MVVLAESEPHVAITLVEPSLMAVNVTNTQALYVCVCVVLHGKRCW